MKLRQLSKIRSMLSLGHFNLYSYLIINIYLFVENTSRYTHVYVHVHVCTCACACVSNTLELPLHTFL